MRFLDHPMDVPKEIFDASIETLWSAPTLEERMSRARGLASTNEAFYARLLDVLLAGPETLFGFSVWRHNADLTLELTRRLKERRPDAIVVFGGPEAIEAPSDLGQPWVDVIIGTGAESLAPLVFGALLARDLDEVGAWEGVWLNPTLRKTKRLTLRSAPALPPIPSIDYAPILPLLIGDPEPAVPVLMNIGCPFRCGFCTNTTIYPTMEWGSVDRIFAEMDQIVRAWATLFPGEPRRLTLEMCDATINADPEQFDALCDLVAAADWPIRPEIHGCFIVDQRITPDRVKKFIAAGISRPFFGLETASQRLRKQLKKPGRIEAIADALVAFRDAGAGKMTVNFNVIIGLPDETEAEFYETVRFLEWAAGLGVVSDVSLMPLSRSPSAMDQALLTDTGGDPRGLRWSSEGPGGSPEVRCRRYLAVFEHFDGILPITSVVPRDIVIRWLMPDAGEAFIEQWCRKHGRADEYFGAPTSDVAGVDEAQPLIPSLARGTAVGAGWIVDGWFPRQGAYVLQLSGPGQQRFAMQVSPRDDARPAFTRTKSFNLSYLREFSGAACIEDASLARRVAKLIADASP